MNWAVKSESAKQSGLNSGDFEELFIDLAESNAESETSSGDSSVQLRDFSAVKADLGAPDIHITPGAPEVYLIPGADHHQHVAADPLQSAASEVEWEGKAGKGLMQDEAEGVHCAKLPSNLTSTLPRQNFSPKQFRLTLQHLC